MGTRKKITPRARILKKLESMQVEKVLLDAARDRCFDAYNTSVVRVNEVNRQMIRLRVELVKLGISIV